MLKSVAFDLDGVAAESYSIHEEAWTKLLAPYSKG
jgi:beta-phosphoglucomutase-like phosphatase (HAD superfamily)